MPMTSDLRQSAPVVGKVDNDVPVIDASTLINATGAARQKLVRVIGDACERPGFFYIDNVFPDIRVLDNVTRQMQGFFDLAEDDPRKQAVNNQHKPGSYGWMPMFGEPAYQPGTIAHLESFDCGVESPSGSKALEGENAWPEIDGFKDAAVDCWDSITETGNAVLSAISEAAGLGSEFLPSKCASQELNTMRLLNYPANDAATGDGNVGIAAHTDFECITMILQSKPGLELTDANGHWYDAPGHDGRMVVLLGDMLERWTNGKFLATGHRVRNTTWQRFSIVLFFAVDDEVTVQPLPLFVSGKKPAAYAPTGQREHIDREIRQAERNRQEAAEG